MYGIVVETLQFSFIYQTCFDGTSMQTLWVGGGGGVQARGVDLTKEQKFWSISKGLGSIHSSNVVKNPHPGAKYKMKDRLCTYF